MLLTFKWLSVGYVQKMLKVRESWLYTHVLIFITCTHDIYLNKIRKTTHPNKSLCHDFFHPRPINLSQRASPAAFTAMTRCAMAHQTPRPLTRCCDAQTKVLSADTETAQDMARQKPLMLLEEKMVSPDLVFLQMHASFTFKGCYKEKAAS